MHDLVIEGGTVVTAEGRRPAHVYVRDGRIAAVTSDRLGADRRQEASGLLVLPGMVDGHVHFQDPGDSSREDFISGSAAAAVGGVSTVIEHTHSHPVRTPDFLKEKLGHLQGRSLVDFGLAAHLFPEDLSQVEALWRTGVQFFKVFTCNTHGVQAVLAGSMLRLLEKIAALNALCLVHCEDEFITADNEERLKALGRTDYGILPEWRSREAEQVAVAAVALLARLTRARTIIAHVSHPAVVDLIARERRYGARLWAETCPQYLYLCEEEIPERGPFRKFTPPARSRLEAEGLWEKIRSGQVSHISADHAPSTRSQKQEGDIWQCHFGLPGVQTSLPLLLDAVRQSRLTLEEVVRLTAETPARIYGLWPRKGRLQAGADADLVLVDPEARHTLSDSHMLSKAGWTPYHGMTVHGRPLATFVRGQLVAQDGKIVADPGTGHFLAGPGAG